MVLVYCDFWAPILKILSNYLIFIVAFVTWDKHIDKYIRWAHIIVSQWYNLTQGYIWHICQFRWLFLVLHLIPWVTATGCAILLSVYQTRQGPRLTWKKSGGGTKYLKSGILTLATFISAKMHFFDQSQAFLELPMHEFSESVEKPKKN